nr:retrotransposon protein, putative, unclassified [Tanacetum cinerariifolium]
MFLNVEQLEKQLDKEYFQEIGSMAAFNVLETQFQMFITSRVHLNDEYVAMTRSYFIQYTQQSILEFQDTLIQHLKSVKKSIDKRVQLKREYDSWVNERQMQTTEEKVDTSKALDTSSADTESGRTESKEQDTSSRSGNDAHDDDADIRPIYDEEPMAEVQMTTEIDVFAMGQQHNEQPEFSNEGEVVQNAEECHDTLQIHQSPRGIFINQAKYTLEILHKHGMDKGQSIGTPMATKHKLDVDLNGNPVDQTDYHSKIGSLMYLTSSRPDIVQASAIAISYNPVQHSRTKHIHTRYHFIKEQVKNGIIELYFVRTEYQLADMFTKALPEDRFKYLVRRIVHNPDFKETKVFLPRKLILSTRISTILSLELFLQDIQSFEPKKKDSVRIKYRNEIKINELKGNFTGMSIEINKKKKLQQLEQVANLSTYPSQHFNSFCYDDDDDEESYTPFKDIIISELPLCISITPVLSTEEPKDSLIMGDGHLDTIPEKESDEFRKLVLRTLSQSQSYLLESLLKRDTLMASSPKFDSLLEEFSGKLAHTDLIPPGINESNCDPESEIELRELRDSRIDKTSDGSEVKEKDKIIASTWNLVNKNLTSAKFSSLNEIVPSTVDTKYTVELAAGKIIEADTNI